MVQVKGEAEGLYLPDTLCCLFNFTLTHVTIAGNRAVTYGGGLFYQEGNIVILAVQNSIIVDNQIAGSVSQNCSLPAGMSVDIFAGRNLSDDDTCGITNMLIASGVQVGPLQDNGGPTLTHTPVDGSWAIDQAVDPCLFTDQRDQPRKQKFACDIGSVEAEASVLNGLASSPTSTENPIILLHAIDYNTLTAITDPNFDLLGKVSALGYDFGNLPRTSDHVTTFNVCRPSMERRILLSMHAPRR